MHLRLVRIIAAVGLAMCAAFTARAQDQTAAAALVIGRVVDASTGKPLSGVIVELASDALPSIRRQATNGDGRYLFNELPAGRLTIRATVGGNMPAPNGFIQNNFGFPITGYLPGGYGQRRPGGALRAIVVASGEAMTTADIQLWKSGVIAGIVTDDLGDPLVDIVIGAARVSPSQGLINGPTTRTDDRGMYRLSGLEPGRYVIFAPQTQVVTPMESVNTAFKRVYDLYRSAETLAGTPPVLPELTGFQVGEALVSSSSAGMLTATQPPRERAGRAFVLPTTFFPGATTFTVDGAITLASGEERSGASFSVSAVRAEPLSGIVMANGVPAASQTLHLVPTGSRDAAAFETARVRTDSSGRFTVPLVPLGSYMLLSTSTSLPPTPPAANAPVHSVDVAGGPGAWLTQPVSVAADVKNEIAVSLRPGLSIRGRVEFVGGTTAPQNVTDLRIAVSRAQPLFRVLDAPATGAVDASLQFAAVGVAPAQYFIRPATPRIGQWFVRSIQVNGRDVADVPVDLTEDLTNVVITYSDRPTSAQVTVTGASADDGAPAVLVFPTDESTWPVLRQTLYRSRVVLMPTKGPAVLSSMLAGEYFVVAVNEAVSGDFPDPVLLKRLAAAATRVRIVADQMNTIALTFNRSVK